MKVRFVIPIRHPDGVADRAKQLAELRQTLASIAAQSSTDWTATLVVNPAQVLPEIPERTRVRHVDLPPNTALAAARDREELLRRSSSTRASASPPASTTSKRTTSSWSSTTTTSSTATWSHSLPRSHAAGG